MRIQHNIMAMNAYRNYNKNTSALAKNLEKLSSGYKINRAGDDAAGLAISEKMRAQITGLEAAQKNVKDGISLVNTSEGAMQEIQDMLNRMVYLSTQSANGTYDNEVDRKNLQQEVDQLRDEINRIADSANFNGIKLLDGSLDADSTANISAGSAIQNMVTNAFKAAGPSAAFNASYITNRPPAAGSQTNTSFSISFDDLTMTNPGSGQKATIEIMIGDASITATASASATGMTASAIAKAVMLAGKDVKASKAAESANGAQTEASKTGTATWDAAYGAATTNTASTATKTYIKIGDHYYKMSLASAGSNTVNFEQVDFMGTSGGEVVHPDFPVEVKARVGNNTGTVNWQVQNTVTGAGVGSSHQAQVSVDLDFSKLKDGDTLTVGDKVYGFQLGATAVTTPAGVVNIDLSSIFKSEADLADTEKQKLALDKIVKDMGAGGSTTWSVGNGGVGNGKGTLTFQSLSDYVDDAANIGGNAANGKCDMKTEASVMKQFFSNSKESAASVSFNVDVTKLKEGDTITIDGTTFEFTDGTTASKKGNIAVDLSKYGLAEGGTIPSYNTADVLKDLQTAITKETNSKYTVTYDGDKMTLTSKDVAGTTAQEQRVAADVKLGSNSYEGSALTLQIGDTSDTYNQLAVSIQDMHTKALGIDDINIGTADGAKAAINVIKDAINNVSAVRGKLGAISNRLDHTANNLSVMRENIQDAESSIRDTDVAEEMMSYTKNNILVQSAQAMLAQANQVPQGVLQLLQ